MVLQDISQDVKVGALVFVRDCIPHTDMPDGLGGWLDDIRDLLGIVTEADDTLVTIDTRNNRYGLEYKTPDPEKGQFIVIDSELDELAAHAAIDAFNNALNRN